MGRRARLEADDELERQLLQDIDALGSSGRAAAAAVLSVSRDVIDHMWAAPRNGSRRPMRLVEAHTLARWLGYELELTRRARGQPPDAAQRAGVDLTIARADREAAAYARQQRAAHARRRRAARRTG